MSTRKAIGVTGFKAREILPKLPSAEPKHVMLSVDGHLIASGDVDEVQLVDDGMIFWLKPDEEK